MNFHGESPPHPLHSWPSAKGTVPIQDKPLPGRWKGRLVETHSDLGSCGCSRVATFTSAHVFVLKVNLEAEAEVSRGEERETVPQGRAAILGEKASLFYLLRIF